jgi:hypothetical protein
MSTLSARRPYRQTAFNLKHNPFPTEAIGKDDDPYSDEAFADEIEQIIDRVVIGGLTSRRQLSFVYSHNQLGGEDTGFGKTVTMLKLRTAINEDLGKSILETLVDADEIVPIGAAYASFNTHQRTGYYPVLADAVKDAATAGEKPLLTHVYERITAVHGTSVEDVRGAISASQVELGVSLRPLTVAAFCDDGAAGVATDITQTSTTTMLRSGNQWLQFLLVAMHAAEIPRLFLFVDQLEDLAMNKSQTRARRYREIGRIRDLLEDEPSRSMLHTTFTMHDTAAAELEEFWVPNRLPSYQLQRANMGQIVLFEGLRDDPAAAEVLAAWMTPERTNGFTGDDHHPFEMSAVRALRERSEGRVGQLLVDAAKVLNAAENDKMPTVDGDYVRELFEDGGVPAGEIEGESAPVAEADDDLLA